MPSEREYLLYLANFPKFGPRSLSRLAESFASWADAWRADSVALAQAGLKTAIVEEFSAWRHSFVPEALLDRMRREGLSYLTSTDTDYPELLKTIPDPPALLYYKGSWQKDVWPVAIVGPRNCSPYGRQSAEYLASSLARASCTIISGLALGIDTAAHEATLAAGGRTIAVIGSGLDRASLFPASNRLLAERIASSGGLVISEFAPGTPAWKQNFIQRNRIIAGLSRALILAEAAEGSGSLITANYALEFGRELFAVPGSIFAKTASASNRLIREGAQPLSDPNDVLAALDAPHTPEHNGYVIRPEDVTERKLWDLLSREPLHIDELARQSGLPAGQIAAILLRMELAGTVRHHGALTYTLP